MTSLRRFPTYASAFTSIGIYYLEEASPPDFDRAQRCFQKAFELDATQGEAAHRLVLGLAEEREWALVDVIAKRVIAGEGGLEGGLAGAGDTSRFLPTNSWAWKAVGSVEMVSKVATSVEINSSHKVPTVIQEVYLSGAGVPGSPSGGR